MGVYNRKIVSTILKECNELEERCDGYRRMIAELISDILIIERGHQIAATNVEKKVRDKFNAVGSLLAERRRES